MDREEIRQGVARALQARLESRWEDLDADEQADTLSLADAAIAAYEQHRPAVVMTREELREAVERGTRERKERHFGKGVPIWEDDRADTEWSLRAAFPWIRVEDK